MDLIPRVSPGQFLVLTSTEVQPHLITETAAALYWDGLAIAETRIQDPAGCVLRTVQEFFGRDAIAALPAPSIEALVFYMEHYEGRLQDGVRQLAAVILTGGLFNSDDGGGRGRVPNPVPPPAPPSPVGATFVPQLAGVPS
jgi:hypothetical protein